MLAALFLTECLNSLLFDMLQLGTTTSRTNIIRWFNTAHGSAKTKHKENNKKGTVMQTNTEPQAHTSKEISNQRFTSTHTKITHTNKYNKK